MAKKYETFIQIRVSNDLKDKIYTRCKGMKISDYIRELIIKDCQDSLTE